MEIRKIKIKGGIDCEIGEAFLQGVLMPTGEFISNGRCIFLYNDDNVYVKK